MYLMYPPVMPVTHVRVVKVSNLQAARRGARELYDLWGPNRFFMTVRGLGWIDMVDDLGDAVRFQYEPTLKDSVLFHLFGA